MGVPSLVLVSMLLASSATAQPQEVRRGPVPAWVRPSALLPVPEIVSGAVFVRRQDVEIHLGDQGQAQYLGYRIKVLQSSALQLGNISIAWNPAAGAPIVHDIRVFRDGQAIDVLKDSSFEILRREDQLEVARLDGMLTAVLRIPDLRVGDEVEVDLTTFANDPTLGRNEAGLLLLAPSPSPGRYHLGLSWDERSKPNLKMTADMTAAMVTGERTVDFRFDNPTVLSPPKDAPARFQWQRAVEYSNFADWTALSRHFAPLYVKAATLAADSPIKREASRIAAAHALPLERASAALKLVQQDVRYIYVGLNGGNLTPASAEETWQLRYGDCKGKTALLLALLTELGIDAEAVLVNSSGLDDGLEQRLPIPQFFDHVLVRAHIDGVTYWLDGTLPPVAAPSVRPVFPVSRVLPLTARGSGIEKLDWRPATTPDEITLFEIDARAGFDKPARIVSTQIVRGIKGLQQQMQFSSVTAGQMLDGFRQQAVGDVWQAIEDVQWRYDQKAAASILTISGTGAVNWEDDGKGARSLALPGGGFNPPERRVRAAGQGQDVPFYTKPEYSCYVTTVRLPSSTEARQWSSKPSFDNRIFGRDYHRAWELRDGSIRMVRGSRVDQPEIDASTALRDNDRISSFDNSMGWIFYDPAGRGGSVGGGEHVPATYEIDWTAAAVPCMPATPGPSKQVASVDATVITAEDLDVETAAFAHGATNEAGARRAALERIVDRKLLLAALPGSKSAPDFASMQPARRRDSENELLKAYTKSLRDGLPTPTEAELDATRKAYSNAFSARQLFMVDQIRFTPTPEQARKLVLIQPDHDLEAVAAHLKAIGISFERVSTTLDTARLPSPVVERIEKLPTGEPFVLPSGDGYTINVIVDRKAAPETAEGGADALTLWRRDRVSRLLKDKISSLRAQSTITYASDSDPGAPAK